jgi:hypothetical protein
MDFEKATFYLEVIFLSLMIIGVFWLIIAVRKDAKHSD